MVVFKKGMKMFCIFMLLLLSVITPFAQSRVGAAISQKSNSQIPSLPIKPLTIGDKVPEDLIINNIINYPSSSAKISDFKGKILIFDFWETYCSNCIAALPKIDSLQQKFKDKIQVITVTRYGNKEQIITRLKRFKKTNDLILPIVITDDLLHKYFPFELVSHVVWIGGDGNVKAITGTEYITAENIQSILEMREVNWPVKNDVLEFDYTQALLTFPNNNIAPPPRFRLLFCINRPPRRS